jgi:hypothetical protein
MPAGLQILHIYEGCDGKHVVIGGERAASDDPSLALVGLLGEIEASGERIPSVTLLLRHRADAAWVSAAVEWLRGHGRSVSLRTSVTLSRPLVQKIRGGEITVSLELAHHEPTLQRALLGPSADTTSALLLQAQHLRAIGIPVAAHLGPLLPGVHDDGNDFATLLHNVVAADVRDVYLSVGRLTGARLVGLSRAVKPGALISLGRAFGLPPGLLISPPETENVTWRLDPLVADGLFVGLRRKAADFGLEVEGCGCPSSCHLSVEPSSASGRRPYVPVTQPELFSDAEAG